MNMVKDAKARIVLALLAVIAAISNPSNAAVGIGASSATADIVDDEIEIRGIKWQDTDGDGIRDAGEPRSQFHVSRGTVGHLSAGFSQ